MKIIQIYLISFIVVICSQHVFANNINSSNSVSNSSISVSGPTIISQSNQSIAITNGVMINGQIITNQSTPPAKVFRKLTNFTQVESQVSANINIILGDINQCVLQGDSKVIKKIATEVIATNGHKRLVIRAKENYSSTQPLNIDIYVKETINTLLQYGAGDININRVDSHQFDVLLDGSGQISAGGQVNQLNITLNGAGDILLNTLKSNNSYVTLNGSGDIELFVSNKLEAYINGNGNIMFSGNPRKVNQQIYGMGELIYQGRY